MAGLDSALGGLTRKLYDVGSRLGWFKETIEDALKKIRQEIDIKEIPNAVKVCTSFIPNDVSTKQIVVLEEQSLPETPIDSNHCDVNDDDSFDIKPSKLNSLPHNTDEKSFVRKNDDDCQFSFPHKSLRERVLKKYNPEHSTGSDSDDLDSFLDKVRTPKQALTWSDFPTGKFQGTLSREEHCNSLDDFIDDDICVIEEKENSCDEVFVIDDSDEEKENNYFMKTFKTPKSTAKTPRPRPTPGKPWRTPATNNRKTPAYATTGTSRRPCSTLESIVTPFAKQKEFKKNKEILVKELFQLYNSTVFENKIPSDFSITWNNKMRSTAGFCYYGRTSGVQTARIELADKVIDSADRLRDTLIHEMCHAAAWLISGIRAGHGPVWKKWASRANYIHHDLPPISRCHSYKINAKFTYRCTNEFCSNSFGRHSKSVDLDKYRCSYCHSRFELQPTLKKDGTPQSARTPNKFALFVKDNYGKIKIPGMAHRDVMKEISSQFSALSTK